MSSDINDDGLPSAVSPERPTAIGREASGVKIERTRFVEIAEWLFLLIALAYLGGRTLPRAWERLNTDFPNYYITARLLREGYDTSRIYEWIWIQRQKDHLGIIGPISP